MRLDCVSGDMTLLFGPSASYSRPINREITEMMDKPKPGTSFLEARAIRDHRLYVSWRAQARAKSVIIHESSYSMARRPAIDSSPSGITDQLEYRCFPVFRRVGVSPARALVPRERTSATFFLYTYPE